MKYKITFTYSAEQDIRNIGFSILEQSKDIATALRFVEHLRSCVQHLDEFPDSGSNPRDRFLINLGYKYLIEGDYLIFYKRQEASKEVFITAVLNGKLDYVNMIKKRL